MIKYYLKYRLKGIQFFVLAMLFYFLIIDIESTPKIIGFDILFLFVSLIVFRFIDDAGSYILDRENHPDRIYLKQPNFTKFVYWTIGVSISYVASLFWFSFQSLLIVSTFISVSVIGYLLFGRIKVILEIIPLLKYPMLLWLLTVFSQDVKIIAAVISSFFIMYAYEKLESKKIYFALISLTIAGLLLYQPWLEILLVVAVIMPLVLTFIFKESKYIKFLPLLYYPLVHLIIILI